MRAFTPTEPRRTAECVVAAPRASDKVVGSLVAAFGVSYDMPDDMLAMLERLDAAHCRYTN